MEERTGNTGSWDAITVSSTAVDTTAKTVTLALASAGYFGRQRPRQSYAKPGTNNLTDAIGNEAAALNNQAVTNNSARPTLAITGPTSGDQGRLHRHFHVQPGRDRVHRHRRHGHPRHQGRLHRNHHRHRLDPESSPPTAAKTTTTSPCRSRRKDAATANGVGNAGASERLRRRHQTTRCSEHGRRWTATPSSSPTTKPSQRRRPRTRTPYTVEERTGNTGSWDARSPCPRSAVNATAKTVTLALGIGRYFGRQRPRQSYAKPGNEQEPDRRDR